MRNFVDEDEIDAFLWEVEKVSKGVKLFNMLGKRYN
jgi:hypothetical protein